MSDSRDRYSRTIAWLKVAFPLGALALLSTLFLLSRAMAPEAVIPFADKEIQDRLRDQQITGPFFSGTTSEGDQISFAAETMSTLGGRVGTNRAEDVTATIQTATGAFFDLTSATVEVDIPGDVARLQGEVSLISSTGYRITMPQLDARVSALDMNAPAQVSATGPLGTLNAGNMRIFSPKEGTGPQMIFSGGVKLVYTPNGL